MLHVRCGPNPMTYRCGVRYSFGMLTHSYQLFLLLVLGLLRVGIIESNKPYSVVIPQFVDMFSNDLVCTSLARREQS